MAIKSLTELSGGSSKPQVANQVVSDEVSAMALKKYKDAIQMLRNVGYMPSKDVALDMLCAIKAHEDIINLR